MNFIRDNIVKIMFLLIAVVVIIVVVVACQGAGTPSDDSVGYLEMENKLQNAAIKYTKRNRTLLPKVTGVVKKIQMDTLINNKYLKEMHAVDNKNVTCTGYVEIIKKENDKEDYRYTPYINCGKYYQTKTIGEYIKDNDYVVTSGDGLYASDKTVYYRGENPKNYIVLGDKLYRIIEITEENNLKVISTTKTEDSYVWDDRFNSERDDYDGINDFEKSRLKDSLLLLPDIKENYAEEPLFTDTEKGYMIEHEFCVGKRASTDKAINNSEECKLKSNLTVGLISLSEYYRASIASNCKEIGQKECNNYNYFYKLSDRIYYFATLTAASDNTYSYYEVNGGELLLKRTSRDAYLVPVFYVDSNTLYKSGTGTKKDPYIVR